MSILKKFLLSIENPPEHIGRPGAQANQLPFIFALIALVTVVFTTPSVRAEGVVIVAFGDSITAGLGVKEHEAWPAVAQKMLIHKGLQVTIVNAGVSGDTTAGGRARLAWSLDGASPKPTFAIVALGGNDALRAVSPENSYQNLEAIILDLKKRGLPVLLAGMLAPPNLGADFGRDFKAIYTRLADKYNVLLFPFLLQDVGGNKDLNQHDGIHPTPEGQKIIAHNILPYIEALLSGKTALK
jgi:acyl-CoA thioesterase I